MLTALEKDTECRDRRERGVVKEKVADVGGAKSLLITSERVKVAAGGRSYTNFNNVKDGEGSRIGGAKPLLLAIEKEKLAVVRGA